ncbi:MAG TPA: DUF3810 family protein [Vicinamibacterales bacterium]|nr:DUF3810 family protein [Vicinamibacterales bacterium]
MKPTARRLFQVMAIAAALVAAMFRPAPGTIEDVYGRRAYPIIQASLTTLSNLSPIAVIDVGLVILIAITIAIWVVSLKRAKKKRLRGIGNALMSTLTLAAIVYLWFLTTWGFNYGRQPLEERLPFDRSRISPAAVRSLAEFAIAQANRTHAAAHAAGFPGIDEMPRSLVTAMQEVERELGRPRTTVMAKPRWSILSPFFRASSVSGMCDPFFLETLLNPDLTGPERPIVLAHEWAHLSGYAPEDEASFVGLLAALRAGPAAEYSAWLDLAMTAADQLQPVTQQLIFKNLADGPRQDRIAIYQRVMGSRIETVDRVAWATYDQALRVQGVEEGVQSYSRVIELVLGTNLVRVGQ